MPANRTVNSSKIRHDRSAFLGNQLSRFLMVSRILIRQYAAVRTSFRCFLQDRCISVYDLVHDLRFVPESIRDAVLMVSHPSRVV